MTTTQTMSCPAPAMITTEPDECPVQQDKEHVSQSINQADVQETIDQSKLVPIPAPPHRSYFGLLGHSPDLDPTLPVSSYWKFMDKYAPIYQLDLGMTHPRVFVGSRELVNEMADDSTYTKFTHRLHKEMRPVFGDGLFSAESTDKAWWKAHRLLVPAFGPIGLSKMFDDMQDLSAQLVLKWDRFGPEHEIECIEDMARLTFDTIGLCAFGYRFNEFYSKEPHPFMKQLKESIVESGKRSNRPELLNQFYYRDEQHRQENIANMRDLCTKIIRDRDEHPKPDAKDLLNVMLNGVDRETGEKLGFENIIYQIPTLLGGGYETTGATLCFIYYFLCNNPDKLRKAQQEVDEIVGDKVLTYDMLRNLKYLDACMKESLRLQHPVSLLTRFAIKDTVLGGKYFIKKGQMVSGIWRHFHRDQKVWGDDADEFRPERMLDVNFKELPPNSWKPFGDGLRACIGRGFAEQEILINVAMTLQKFDVEQVNPDYRLQLTGQMGIKPVDFKIRVHRRPDRSLMVGIPGGGAPQRQDKEPARQKQPQTQQQQQDHEVRKPVSVFFGGNMGTSESLVQALSRSAPTFGLDLVDVRDLDTATRDKTLPTDKPLVIIIPSYEGRPPDNAKKFVAWIEQVASKGEKLPAGTRFTVFGVGNSDWTHTFHKVPRLVDETLEKIGAERIMDAGFANVKRDLIGPWEAWSEQLCMTLSGTTMKTNTERIGMDVHIEKNNLNTLPQALGGEQMAAGVVVENRELADTSVGAAKRHVEIRLPAGTEYRSGDYLVVQGRNPDETVSRAMKRFGLSAEDVMRVPASTKDFIPAQPMAIEHFLRSSVELNQPITSRQLGTLATYAPEGSPERTQLETMRTDAEYQSLLDKRYSILDVLEEVPGLTFPFGVYIDLLPPLAPRLYSISSSPLHPSSSSSPSPIQSSSSHQTILSLTFDLLSAPAKSGHGTFHGVTSSHLAALRPGDPLACLVRSTKLPFRLPPNPLTPVIMLAAGSGIAPFRAFCQERASVLGPAGERSALGPAVLYFGCRHPDRDFLYREEFTQWERQGVVRVVGCFSKPTGEEGKGRRVPDALWEDREWLTRLICSEGAHVYVCGSAAKLGRSVVDVLRRVGREVEGNGEREAEEWLEGLKAEGRFVSDVY